MIALTTLGRREEALQIVDRIIADQPGDAISYIPPWAIALRLEDHRRAAAVVVAASRNVRAAGWPELRRFLIARGIWPQFQELRRAGLMVERAQLADALYRIGWPNDHDRSAVDSLRSILVEERISQGAAEEARQIIATITTVDALLPMLVQSRYDPAFPGVDRIALLRTTLAQQDRHTEEALAAAPANIERLLDRMAYLRKVGRDAEVVRLLEPYVRDVAGTVGAHESGMWVINSGVDSLQSLGRHDEAIRLMQRLTALPIEGNQGLVGPAINRAIVLLDAGRPAAALEDVLHAEREFGRYANDYGRSVMAANAVCALAALDRRAEAEPWLARLRANQPAGTLSLLRALLCMGDIEGAEPVVLAGLRGDLVDSLILRMQDYELATATERNDPAERGYRALRERPAVRAELARVGRILSLPLAR